MLKRRFFIALCAILASLSLTACRTAEETDIFAYTSADAIWQLVIESEYGEITLDCTKTGGVITAVISSPERSRGVAVRYDGMSCTLDADGMQIPLSAEAADGLTKIFDIMFRGAEGASIARSADGEETVVTYSLGKLTLGRNMLPASVTCGRCVKILSYLAEE